MAAYFLDTSALVKRHVVEPGYSWVRALCALRKENDDVVAEIALVEVAAAFSRMARASIPRLTVARRNRVISDFERCFLRQYTVIQVDRAIFTRAAAAEGLPIENPNDHP